MMGRGEGGFTLVELIVSVFVFSLISAGMYQVLFGQARGGEVIKANSDIAEEVRMGFARMVRDTREADVLTAASPTSFTIKVNFNGDGLYQNPNSQGDDEILTYAFDETAGTITLNGQVLMRGVSKPGNPAEDVFQYSSNFLEYDWPTPPATAGDGTTTWLELDRAPDYGVIGVGNDNGMLDAGEFPYITTIAFSAKVSQGGRSSNYYATSQLRNRV